MISPLSIIGFLSLVLTGFGLAIGWRLGNWLIGKVLK